jgi:hypothetical protein
VEEKSFLLDWVVSKPINKDAYASIYPEQIIIHSPSGLKVIKKPTIYKRLNRPQHIYFNRKRNYLQAVIQYETVAAFWSSSPVTSTAVGRK